MSIIKEKDKLKIAAVQMTSDEFDKKKNIDIMEELIIDASKNNADIISFPEICITGCNIIRYTKNKKDLNALSENISNGPSFKRIANIAKKFKIAVLYGFLENENAKLFNTYVAVRPDGTSSKYRKIHAFENSFVSQGNSFDLFDLYGWKCGTLICNDNNLPENARMYMLKGCELLFSPHQTGALDIEVAGMGRIDVKLWTNRNENPDALYREFQGPKGREWLLKWYPSRSYDNGFYSVFTNGVGLDHDEIRTGNAMIIDPNGLILAESKSIETDIIYADISKKALEGTFAFFNNKTRRPELYAEIVKKTKRPG